MRSRRFWLIGAVIALYALGLGSAYADAVYAQPEAQPQENSGVTLRYKFTTGELLRYNMKMVMNMNMVISGQAKAVPMTMTGVYRIRTVKVLSNGDAEVRAAIESMKNVVDGHEMPMKASSMPVFSYVMSPRGEMSQFKTVGGGGMMGAAGNPLGGMSGMQGTSPVFPENGVKVGDAWSQEMPFPGGNGGPLTMDGKVKNQFLLTTMSTSVASIQQSSTGNFQMKMNAGNNGGTISSDGDIDMKGTQCFSTEKGRLVSTNVSGVTHVVTTVSGGNVGNIAMDIQMTMTMNLIQ